MKVKELIEHLKAFDKDARVFLSSDEEGNYYSPLADKYFVLMGNFDDDKKNSLARYDNWSIDESEKQGKYVVLFPW